MNFLYLLIICGLGMVASLPQYKIERRNDWIPPATTNNQWPQIQQSGGGTPQKGLVDINVHQKIWESPNKQHSIGLNGGYSNKWGDPHVSTGPDLRFGAGYTFSF